MSQQQQLPSPAHHQRALGPGRALCPMSESPALLPALGPSSSSPAQGLWALLPAFLWPLLPALPGTSAQGCLHCPAKRRPRGTAWHWPLINSFLPQAFGRYLRSAERTGVVLAAIEILGRSSLLDKKGPVEFLEMAMKSPKQWLTDVSGLWLGCPGLEPCQVPASLPPKARCVRLLRPPGGSRAAYSDLPHQGLLSVLLPESAQWHFVWSADSKHLFRPGINPFLFAICAWCCD